MANEISEYVARKRGEGQTDNQIREKLLSVGWDAASIERELSGDNDDVPRPPAAGAPTPVVQSLSTRGFEYSIMFISMGFFAVALGSIMHSVVDQLAGTESYLTEAVPIATATLLVSFPIFALLFLRLKKAERDNVTLRHDPSRRRAIQLTLGVTFIWGLIKVISYVYGLLNASGGGNYFGGESSAVSEIIHLVITLGIAGSIFAYYWRDTHRSD